MNVYWSADEVAEVSHPTVVTVVSTVPSGERGVVATITVPESLTMVPGGTTEVYRGGGLQVRSRDGNGSAANEGS